jgi:two-component system, cell cycle sensor histidine kinase and response regulator CckA
MSNDHAGVLSDREDFYAHVVHSLNGIVWEADARTFTFSFVSSQAEAVLGFSVEEWLHDPNFWQKHTHPDDVEWCAAFCRDATAQRRDHSFEYRMIAADGRTVWLRDIVTVQSAPDRPERLVGIMLDITEQKRVEAERRAAEDRLRHNEAWWRRLIERSWDATFVVDRTGTILFASPAAERILRYTPAELEHSAATDLVVPEDRGGFESFLQAVFEKQDAGNDLEYRVQPRHGTERTLQAFATRSHDSAGAEVAILNTRDVTDKLGLQAQLHTAQKMEAIGLLAGGIAHDFNNLLTVIRGYAEMVCEQVAAQGSDQDVREILRAADRATVLTQQLLAFSRRQAVHPSVIEVSSVITDLSKMLERLIGENIRLRIDTSSHVPPIFADVGQIGQVLMNLAVNARDAMPFGGELTISSSATSVGAAGPPYGLPPGRYAVVTVADTGSGIAPEIQTRIFEPFFTTKEPGKGTGLGLPTAYGIMQQSRGYIDVRSEVGRGTTFTLYFPESPTAPPVRSEPSSRPADHGTETILLVEDEEAVRHLAARTLRAKGYTVLTAAGGTEALDICRQHPGDIAVLVTDVVMPGLSGPELADRLSAHRPCIKVVYMSGYAGDAVTHHGIESGVGFIAKPFTADALATGVRQILEADGR